MPESYFGAGYNRESEWEDVSHGDLTFSNSGAGTWTVQAADLELFRYRIDGKIIHIQLSIANSSLAALATVLTITTPFAFKAPPANLFIPIVTNNNGTMSFGVIGWNGSQLNFYPNLTAPANWAIAVNTTGFWFNGSIELE